MTDAAQLDELTAQYRAHGRALADAVHRDVPRWLDHLVKRRLPSVDATESGDVRREVAEAIDQGLRVVVEAHIDEPVSGPLETIRSAMGPLNSWLDQMEAPHPPRDPRDVELRPDDRYDLGPMRFDDISPQVHDAGIAWGAAKAFLHRATHRPPEAGASPLD